MGGREKLKQNQWYQQKVADTNKYIYKRYLYRYIGDRGNIKMIKTLRTLKKVCENKKSATSRLLVGTTEYFSATHLPPLCHFCSTI